VGAINHDGYYDCYCYLPLFVFWGLIEQTIRTLVGQQ
jgi:hypothetical protein